MFAKFGYVLSRIRLMSSVKKIEYRLNYDWVEYAKGIGIILVVYGHVARGVFNAGMIDNPSFFKLVDSVIYSFHMPLFFFISGLFFVSSIKNRGIIGLFTSKVNTIAYPYFVWSLMQGGIAYVANPITNFNTTLVDIYSIPWVPMDQFWFLYVLFLVFIMASIIYKLTSNVVIIFLISLVLFVFNDVLASSWAIMNVTYQYMLYFCAGMLFFQYWGEWGNKFVWLCGLVFLFIVSHWLYQIDMVVISERYFKVVMAFIGIALIIVLSNCFLQMNVKVIKIIGSYSLGIYLLHVLLGSGFRVIMQKVFYFESSAFHLIFGTLVGTFLSIICLIFLKKQGWLLKLSTEKFREKSTTKSEMDSFSNK